jgi:hypothetical protein
MNSSDKSCAGAAGAAGAAAEQQYIDSMTDVQKCAFKIAREHLRHSYCMEKSNGYKEFCAAAVAAAEKSTK